MTEAEQFKARFPTSLYERWEIAGSLRRMKADIGDVEHVVQPRLGPIADPDSIFPSTVTGNLLFHWLDLRLAESPDQWPRHNYNYDGQPDRPNYKWGPKYRGLEYLGFGHEIFCTTANNWGNILWLRTGPDRFNQRIIHHINTQTRLQHLDGYLRYRASGEILACPNEEDFFNHIGLPFVPPEKRLP
jgi:DNA polymerase/3'-5' exonuclease PolX